MRKIYIEPSLLSANFANLEKDIKQCEIGGAEMLHLDIMDGHFVPNITIGPFIVEAIRKITHLPLVCHLMIADPDKYIPKFAEAGANYISFHVEANSHINRTLGFIRSFGLKSGIALNPGTPIQYAIENAEYCDYILLMSVNPGFGGQELINKFFDRCSILRSTLDSYNRQNVLIEADGGIKINNLKEVIKAGADMIVSGSGIFQGNIVDNIKKMREIAQKFESKTGR